jgi:hypothetical protein
MIKVERDALPPNLPVFTERVHLSQDNVTLLSKAELEREQAIAFFTDPANFQNEKKITEKNFKFAVYKDAGLVEALESFFHKKCAYCEINSPISSGRYRHFRPAESTPGRKLLPITTGWRRTGTTCSSHARTVAPAVNPCRTG